LWPSHLPDETQLSDPDSQTLIIGNTEAIRSIHTQQPVTNIASLRPQCDAAKPIGTWTGGRAWIVGLSSRRKTVLDIKTTQ